MSQLRLRMFRPWPDQPDRFRRLCYELESEKLVVKKFMKYYKKIVGLSLDQGGSSLSNVDENDKATWLIATCGFDTVARVIQGIQSLPVRLTRLQQMRVIF